MAELSASTLPLGGKTTRGLGKVEVTSITISGADNTVITAPAYEKLWPVDKEEAEAAANAADAFLTYLSGEPDKRQGYAGWADYLPEPNATENEPKAHKEVKVHE